MQTVRQLPRESWSSFFDELTGERRGDALTLIIDWEQLGEEVEAHHVLLEGMTYDARGDVLEVSALRPSTAGPTVLRHEVSGPTSVELDSPAGVLPTEVRITGADGAVTVARLAQAAAMAG
jgi:hypothetical protein